MERARRHYEQRGFLVEASPSPARADLLVEKNGRQRLVRVDDDPLGAYQIGALAAAAKRARLKATVICPASPDVLEACDQFGVEHLSPEGLGEEGPVVRAASPAAMTPDPSQEIPDVVASPVVRPEPVKERAPRSTWRWSVVALVWLAAVAAWALLLSRVF